MAKEYLSFVKESGQDGFEFVDGANEHLFVGEISSVNMLIGANNARKSRFLRMLVSKAELPLVSDDLRDTFIRGIETFDKLTFKVGNDELINVNESDGDVNGAYSWLSAFDGHSSGNEKERYGMFRQALRQAGDRLIFDKETVAELRNRYVELFIKREEILVINNGAHIQLISDFFDLLYQNHHKTLCCGAAPTRLAFNLLSNLKDEFLRLKQSLKDVLYDLSTTPTFNRVFIPSLRGSLPVYDNSFINSRLYERTTSELYFTARNVHDGKPIRCLAKNAIIYSGDDLHRTILNDKNSSQDRRRRFEQFQNFIGDHFFKGKRVEFVAQPDSKSKTVLVAIQGEEERELKDVGDGIQQLIILLHPIFMAEENAWIFIDEPELSLHPGFQNLLLDTVLNNPDLKTKNLRYFMTTHSNHFLKGGKNIKKPVELPYLRVANVQDGYLDLTEIKTITVAREKVERYTLQVDDLLLTEGGDFDKLGRGTLWRGEIELCVHQNHVFAVRANREIILPTFLSNLTGSHYGKTYFLKCAKQSTNLASISTNQLRRFPALVPPLPEQEKIAEVLSCWDEGIQTLGKMIKEKKLRKKGLMQQLLTGGKRLPAFQRSKDRGQKSVDEIPNDWTEVRLKEVLQRTEPYEKLKSGKSYSLVSVRRHARGIFDRGIIPRENISYDQMAKLRHHNFIISKRQVSHGAYALVEREHVKCYVSSEYVILEPTDNRLHMPYLEWISKQPIMWHKGYVSSNGVHIEKLILDPKHFLKHTILLPSLDEQKAIVEVLKTAEEEIQGLEDQLAALNEQKKGLMQKLLTGEIRHPDFLNSDNAQDGHHETRTWGARSITHGKWNARKNRMHRKRP